MLGNKGIISHKSHQKRKKAVWNAFITRNNENPQAEALLKPEIFSVQESLSIQSLPGKGPCAFAFPCLVCEFLIKVTPSAVTIHA